MKLEKKRLCALKDRIEGYCKENQIFGVLRVTVQDEILLEQRLGYADLENKRPFTERSAFTLYSLSKPFCAIGLLKLLDAGKIDLDAHPSRYLPEARDFDARVTLRTMLHHTSGLPDFELDKAFSEAHRPGNAHHIRAQLPALARLPQLFAPDTSIRYSNVNFVLCALIIESISGLSYEEYIKREVFAPLHMKTAIVDNEHCTAAERVQGYELKDGKPTPIAVSRDWMLGAGDIVGTTDDVYALNTAVKRGLILSPNTWRQALTPTPLGEFGMGCRVSLWHGKRCITHNGGHLGFRTLHKHIPEDDLDIIFLSNSGYGSARPDISEMVFSAFYGELNEPKTNEEMDKGYI